MLRTTLMRVSALLAVVMMILVGHWPAAQANDPLEIKVNFQDETGTVPEGYLRDLGESYDVRTAADQGSGTYTYGWVDITTGDPISLVGQGRTRGLNTTDSRLDTTIHMEHPSTPPSGFWQIELPNGTYDIEVAVGDADLGNDPEVHRINAEGVNLIDDFVPSGGDGTATRHTVGTGTVTVEDGILNVDYLGGSATNTKLNYIIITENQPTGAIQVNFQEETGPVPAGFLRDFGEAFGVRTGADQGSGTYEYGWISTADGTPISLVGQGRNRDLNLTDELLDTTIHMEHPNTPPTGFWEIALPNGTYEVTVAAGDADQGNSPEVHRVNAEGVNLIDDFVPSGSDGTATRHTTGTGTVTVSDGALTLDYLGGAGINTKLNYVIITPIETIDSLAFTPAVLDVTQEENTSETYIVSLATSSGTAAITLDPGTLPSWLSSGSIPTSVDENGAPVEAIIDTTGLAPGTYSHTITANATGYESADLVIDLEVTAAPVEITFPLAFNFQLAGVTTPDGFTADVGAAYGEQPDGLTYGWLTVAGDTPIDAAGATRDRDRGGSTPQELDTIIHMQRGDCCTSGFTDEIYWEIDLPNGTYEVTVSVGDEPSSTEGYDSQHQINLEGTPLFTPPFQADENNEYTTATAIVEVTDGALTMDPIGGVNTKPNYILIDESDGTLGALAFTPAGLDLTQEEDTTDTVSVNLATDTGSTDVTIDDSGFPAWLAVSAPTSVDDAGAAVDFTIDTNGVAPGTYSYTVTAGADNYDAAQLLIELEVTETPPSGLTFPLAFNFQLDGAPVPSGYTAETGAAYGAQPDGLTYGWLDINTNQPIDASPATRDRDRGGIPQELDTIIHMQRGDCCPTGFTTEVYWEIDLPNGWYEVTVSVGDEPGGEGYDSQHQIRAEAIELFDVPFQADANTEYATETAIVEVTDGKLTIDAVGGVNTKPNYILIDEAEAQDFGALSFLPATLYPVQLEGTTEVYTSTLSTDNDATGFSLDLSGAPAWLVDASAELTSVDEAGIDVEIEIDSTGLAADTYFYTITATAPGYAPAELLISLEVTESASDFVANVNFQEEAAPIPTGYARDFGQAFGPRTDLGQGTGLTYGWVAAADGITPLSLEGNGRDRGFNDSQLLDTLIHMQYGDTGGANGIPAEGIWEIEVPPGTYTVTVAVGDAENGSALESHTINVEGINAVNAFPKSTAPDGADERHTSATVVVTVLDGRLTVDADGGTNTKINYIEITGSGASQTPAVLGSSPANGATGVSVETSIATTQLFMPNEDDQGRSGVDNSTITTSTVFLYPTADGPGAAVPATVNGTGGGDAIVLTPVNDLAPFTQYTFVIDGVLDNTGVAFATFSASFTTGSEGGGSIDDVEFEQLRGQATSAFYSSLTLGPDDRLYAATIGSGIFVYDINPDGTLTNEQNLGFSELSGKAIIGLVFDPTSTAANAELWITVNEGNLSNSPNFTGKLVKLTGTDLDGPSENWTYEEYVDRLPRSKKDHLSNSLVFGPNGERALYMTQGSISAMGAPDSAWGFRDETLLSAAVLRFDLTLLESYVTTNNQPLDVFTDDLGFGDPNLFYDPQAPNAPVTVFATGVRNAYDLAWHPNGYLYIPTNGSAGGGNSPGYPADEVPFACDNRLDGVYSGGNVPAITNHPTQRDFLFAVEEGGYYGHPNPTRCEWVLNSGNPTAAVDPGEPTSGSKYAVGVQPDPNYRGFAYDFANNKSPNGVIVYESNIFGGALQGSLLVVRYSGGDDIMVLTPGGSDGVIDTALTGGQVTGFSGFNNPLDIIEDTRSGNLYVAESNGIALLRPVGGQPEPDANATPDTLTFDQVISAGGTSQSITIENNGTANLTIDTLTITGSSAFSVDTGILPLVVIPGESTSIDVTFDPSAAGPAFATLVASGNDAVSVELRGLGEAGTGGSNEPSLQWILDVFGIAVDTGDDNDANNVINSDTSSGNMNSLLGDEIIAQSFQKAGSGDVTVELLAVYGPTSANPIVEFGWYTTGDAGSITPLFDVDNSPQANGQSLLPPLNGVTSFDPGSASFGFYSEWPFFSSRQLFSEDGLNTFSGAIPHHVRVYAVPGEANAYVVATEEHISGFDYQDVVVVVRNVTPTALPVDEGDVRFENLTWEALDFGANPGLAWLNTWLTMSRIQNPSANNGGGPLLNQEEATLRIHNDSTDEPLTITGLTISDTTEFTLPNGEDGSLPLVIQPGDFYDLDVQFIETSGSKGVRSQTLTINTSDGANPEVVIELRGAWMQTDEGSNEVTADHIADAFGIQPDSQGRNLLPLSSEYVARYDEVLSYRWQRANPDESVYVRQLAAYHGCCNSEPSFSISGSGGGGFQHEGFYGQSLLPIKNNTLAPAEAILNPTSSGFTISAAGYSTDRCESVINGGNTCFGHGMRVWPVFDPDGNLVPNTYFAIQDYVGSAGGTGCGAGSANCDFNDNIYLITNIQPADPADRQAAVNVTITPEDTTGAVDTNFTYTIAVENTSIFQASNAEASIALPSGMSFVSAPGCTESGGTVTCDVGNLLGSATAETALVVQMATPGEVTLTVDITADDGVSDTADATVTFFDPDNLPGSVTIIKEAAPTGSTPFEFTFNGETFTLTDDGATLADGVSINFQNEAAPLPAGFDDSDWGEAYGDRGNGFTYGWVTPGTDTPLDLSTGGNPPGNGRDRGCSTDGIPQELDTLFHMQYDDTASPTNGVAAEGAWEIDLPNGTYQVTVSAGDCEVDGSPVDYPTHVVNVEGVTAIDGFAPGGSGEGTLARFESATVTVEVTDGRLTVDAAGGFNTKINYITIAEVTSDNTKVFESLTPGSYTLSETPQAGWALDSIVCTSSIVDSPNDGTFSSSPLTINLLSAEDLVCTVNNVGQANEAPIIDPIDDLSVTEGDTAQIVFNVKDEDANNLTIDVASTPDASGLTDVDISEVSAGLYTIIIDFTPQTNDAGTYAFEVTADDGLTSVSETFTLTVNAPSNTCPLISTLPCSEVPVSLPFVLDWAADEGGLPDGTGVGTGFTMVDPPSAPNGVSDAPTPDSADAPGYASDKLSVTGGQLVITATKGIQYYQPANSTETNSQINAMGVAFDANSFPVVIETQLVNPDFTSSSGNNSQQAGLWFGLNEDQYVKLVVSKSGTSGTVELLVENLPDGNSIENEKDDNAIPNVASETVTLRMTINPLTGTATGEYSTDGVTFTQVGTLTLPAAFTDGDTLGDGSGPYSFAGVFSTLRRANATPPIDFAFEGFSITPTVGTGTLTIVKDARPDSDEAFEFVGDLGPFTLTDDGTGTADTFTTTLLPGTYDITESVPEGWDMTSAFCEGNTDEDDLTFGSTVTVGLDDGEDITCTFVNEPEPNDAPVVTPPANTTPTVTEGETLRVAFAASDADGDALTIDVSPDATFITEDIVENFAGNYTITLDFAPQPGDAGAYTITVTADDNTNAPVSESITLTVEEETFTLTTNVVGSGTIDVDPDQTEFTSGATVALTATPAADWEFDGWEVDGQPVNAGAALNLTITADTTVTAVFVEVVETPTPETPTPETPTPETPTPETPTPPPDGEVVYRINTGGNAVTVGGVDWDADTGFSTPSNGNYHPNDGWVSTETNDDLLYLTERSSVSDTTGFIYELPVTDGDYTVRLHFAESWFVGSPYGQLGPNPRIFDVSIEGTEVLSNYNIIAQVGILSPIVETFEVTVSDGGLTIDFPPADTNRPKISGIEVIAGDDVVETPTPETPTPETPTPETPTPETPTPETPTPETPTPETPTPETPTPDGPEVTDVLLINALDDVVVGSLTEGQVISIADLGTNQINFEALVNDQTSAVEFDLAGPDPFNRTDGWAPFTMQWASLANYGSFWIDPGSYTLTLTPSGSSGTGTPTVITFTIVEDDDPPTGPAVTDVLLINGLADVVVGSIQDGDTINLGDLGTNQVNFEALVSEGTTAVEFDLAGPDPFSRTDGWAPFTMQWASPPNYGSFWIDPGSYTLTVTPSAGGLAGTPTVITFTIVDTANALANPSFNEAEGGWQDTVEIQNGAIYPELGLLGFEPAGQPAFARQTIERSGQAGEAFQLSFGMAARGMSAGGQAGALVEFYSDGQLVDRDACAFERRGTFRWAYALCEVSPAADYDTIVVTLGVRGIAAGEVGFNRVRFAPVK